jgi:2-keto-4-pentenoate hydratase/2-oxohepta-3-ene-1,7-dioic acid hydratase in catechol pathway
LRDGDEVRVEIEGLGELVNPVVKVGRGATPAA